MSRCGSGGESVLRWAVGVILAYIAIRVTLALVVIALVLIGWLAVVVWNQFSDMAYVLMRAAEIVTRRLVARYSVAAAVLFWCIFCSLPVLLILLLRLAVKAT